MITQIQRAGLLIACAAEPLSELHVYAARTLIQKDLQEN